MRQLAAKSSQGQSLTKKQMGPTTVSSLTGVNRTISDLSMASINNPSQLSLSQTNQQVASQSISPQQQQQQQQQQQMNQQNVYQSMNNEYSLYGSGCCATNQNVAVGTIRKPLVPMVSLSFILKIKEMRINSCPPLKRETLWGKMSFGMDYVKIRIFFRSFIWIFQIYSRSKN